MRRRLLAAVLCSVLALVGAAAGPVAARPDQVPGPSEDASDDLIICQVAAEDCGDPDPDPPPPPPPAPSETPPPPPDAEVGCCTPSGATAVSYQGSEYLFVRGLDNAIYLNRFDGRTWSGFSVVPGGGATLDAPDAVVYFGVLHLFVRGTNDRIYQNRFDGASWSGWGEIPGNGFTPSAPSATTLGGELHIFVRGTNDRIYQNRFDRFAGSWSGWGEVAGGGLTPSAPESTVFNNGQLDVLELVMRGQDSRIYQNQFNPFLRAWSGWSEVPGGGLTPSGPDVSVSGDRLDIAVRGFDDHLYLNRFDGTSWSGWISVSSLAVLADDPALNVFNGSMTVLARVADNRVFRTIPLPDVPLPLDGDGSAVASTGEVGAAAAAVRILCRSRSLPPLMSGLKLVGTSATGCSSRMANLSIVATLWRAVPAQLGGMAGFWTPADTDFDSAPGSDAIQVDPQIDCRPGAGPVVYVVTALHNMIPPPGFRPPTGVRITNSGTATVNC